MYHFENVCENKTLNSYILVIDNNFHDYTWFPKSTDKQCFTLRIKMWQHPQIYTLYKGGKVQFITGWAQRVNGSYSLFHIENVWTLSGSVSNSDFCCHAESVSLASTGRGETDKMRRKRRVAASVGFTVAMETMSDLLDTCFWRYHMPDLFIHSKKILLCPYGYWRRQKHRYAAHLCANC